MDDVFLRVVEKMPVILIDLVAYPLRLYLDRLVLKESSMVVRGGPFAGLKYVDTSIGSRIIPKLLGTYELELQGVCQDIIDDKSFDHIVNIGAGEGYYAVGFAVQTHARIEAFETSREGQKMIAHMASLNGVRERVSVYGTCEVEDLYRSMSTQHDRSLIICDVEGYEIELLDAQRIPMLRRAHILAEIHDFAQPGASRAIQSRFSKTHRITRIRPRKRRMNDFPYSTFVTRLLPEVVLYRLTLHERRFSKPTSWNWMVPRSFS
jgi:hypothetical protein